MVICSACGATTPEDEPNCGACGSSLAAAERSLATSISQTRPLRGLAAPFAGSTGPLVPAAVGDPGHGSSFSTATQGTDRAYTAIGGASPLLQEGQLLAGRYRVGSHIGFGSMGTVWRGTDERLEGRPCAIKTIDLARLGAHEATEAKAMFEREISVLSKLSHPGICEIRDVVTEDDVRFLIMEFVDGYTLAERLKIAGGRALPEDMVLDWAAQLVDALSYLHRMDPPLIFRDVKPQNVILRPDGRVTLVDFGIARTMVMAGGTAIGTGGYAPPEQYQGLADARSDEYALAATLHHLLTGRDPTLFTPFVFPRARSIVPTISEHVDLALERALNMASTSRFPSMAEFGLALQGRLGAQTVTAAQLERATGGSRPEDDAMPAGLALRSGAYAVGPGAGMGGSTIQCSSCGQANVPASAYCNACGLRLGVAPAGFWIRTGAYVVDSIALVIVGKIIGPVLDSLSGPTTSWTMTVNSDGYTSMAQTTNASHVLISFTLSCLISLLYFGVCWTRAGRTPGMRIFGLKVLDCSGDLMTWPQAIGRYLMLFVSFICMFLGVISVAWQKDKRGWHDLASGTEVIRSK